MDARTAAALTAAPDEAGAITARLADQLLGVSRRLGRAQRRLMEPLGITPAQARLLRTISHCEEPPRMADLAQRLEVVPRAVTTLVDGLEERGLARRVPDPDNRRVVRVELCEEGRAALSALRTARREAAADLLAPLDTEQRAQLSELLDALHGACTPSGA
ncbi:MarR family winged helix-turn-helix transcriptional regulator [Actinacidiphila yeochonensis]|uniref:MarR family winged helix-turn-helix transcriptional regulator n=1 Tax=Actinacidiphila yeochonensis TaxID=89050 RepID=UPI00099BDA73|nr:MarR family transcriptional regulator [Actinacidiphila yeochonensis]